MSIIETHKSQSKIDQNELIRTFYGTPERFQLVMKTLEMVSKIYPKEQAYKYYELDRIEQIKMAYKFMAEFIKSKLVDMSKEEVPIEINNFVNFELPGSVSALMVRPLIAILCNEKQKQKWLPLFDTGFLCGAYAQTELGHGSDVQSLETEAVYDDKTKEFVIHSPTPSSYKWWPGELSNLGAIAIVFAKTIIKGKKIGVLPFIVQIRDFTTHQPLSGIEIGDIGPKLGYQSKENGFLRFIHHRIPLENMPSRFSEITDDGQLIKKGNPKIIYSSMMRSRAALLEMSSGTLGKAVAIALRYSFIRKQFKNELKEEVPVIQYQLQQYRLFGLLAKTYAMRCAFNQIIKVINQCNKEIEQNDFKNLQETHILLSGAKAWYTWWCGNGLNVCMNCCGGHGFSKYSGIPFFIETFAPNTILEGENTMLSLQVGAFLLKCMKNVHEGKPNKISGYCRYLTKMDELLEFNSKFDQDLLNSQKMILLWQKSVVAKLSQIGEKIIEQIGGSSITSLVSTKLGISVFEVAKLHTILFTFDFFIQYIETIEHAETKEAYLVLASLFIAEQTIENSQILVGLDVLSREQLKAVQASVSVSLDKLYKDSLKLSDVLYLDDKANFSLISMSNEKPYDNLYSVAKNFGMVNSTDLTGYYLSTIRKSSIEKYGKPKL